MDDYPLDEHDLCSGCREGQVTFDRIYSFGSYEGTLRKLIHLLKYGKVERVAKPLSRFLLQALPLEHQFDAVIAMPTHWRKRWLRGFNQAELLARPVARRYGLGLSSNLRRTRVTESQAGLSRTQRQMNLRDSFAVRKPEQIRGKRILLIDDVFTTGATLRAATSCLKKAGAEQVIALTVARVDSAPAIVTGKRRKTARTVQASEAEREPAGVS